jgi:hypothetical protein
MLVARFLGHYGEAAVRIRTESRDDRDVRGIAPAGDQQNLIISRQTDLPPTSVDDRYSSAG